MKRLGTFLVGAAMAVGAIFLPLVLGGDYIVHYAETTNPRVQ